MNPNKRLTIVGKFRLNDDKPEYRFTNRENPNPQKGIFPLNPDQLFMTLQPELCIVENQTITIDNKSYAANGWMSPLEVKNEGISDCTTIPITLESPLFDTKGSTDEKEIQKKGGQLFKGLLENLDVIVPFTSKKFSQALLKIAKEYLVLHANASLNKQKGLTINPSTWNDIFLCDRKLTTATVKYLMAFSDDTDGIIEKEFVPVLRGLIEDNKNLASDVDHYCNAFSTALKACRQELLTTSLTSDALKKDENSRVLRRVAKQEDMKWLVNYSTKPEYYIGNNIKASSADFAHYYRLFIENSDNLHRFIRSGSLHSFLFCWLISKYQAHSDGQPQVEASAKAYQVGIYHFEPKGERNIPLDEEKRKLLIEAITATGEQVIKEYEKSLKEDKSLLELFKTGIKDRNNAMIKRVLYPKEVIDSEDIKEWCNSLFKETLQKHGGGEFEKLGEKCDNLLPEYSDVFQAYTNWISDPENQSKSDLSGLKTAMLSQATSTNLKNIVEKTFSENLNDNKTEEKLVAIGEHFAKGMSAKINKDHFAEGFIAKKGAIKEFNTQLDTALQWQQRLYIDARSKSNDSGVGILGTVPLFAIPDLKEKEEPQKKRQKKFQDEILALERKSSIPLPKTTLTLPLDEGNYAIEYKTEQENKKIGELTIAKAKKGEDNVEIEKAPVTTVEAEKGEDKVEIEKALVTTVEAEDKVEIEGEYEPINELPENIKLVLKDKQGKSQEVTSEKDRNKLLSPLQSHFTQLQEFESEPEKLWESITKTENKGDEVLDKYGDKDDLAMSLRALVLGSLMLATPKDKISLGEQDLSQILGLILEMVQHIGTLNSKTLFNNEPSDGLLDIPLAGLNAINLSRFYPSALREDGNLNAVLQYHYDICKKVGDISSYMNEVQELSRIFEALRFNNDIEIKLINQTLEEHVNNTQSNEELLLCEGDKNNKDHHSLFVYLTGQSDAQKGLISLQKLLTDKNGVLSQNGWLTQLPIFITKKEVNVEMFPIISSNSIELPDFSQFKVGIQGVPLLELCLSLMMEIHLNQFGKLTREDQSKFDNLKEGCETPASGDSVSEYLKTLWFTHPTLRSNLIFLKWFNLGLQDLKTNKKRGQNWKLGKRFGKFLKEVYANSDWEKAFEGLERIDNFSLNSFQVKMEPRDNSRRLSQTDNPPGIDSGFGFEISEDNTNQAWQLAGIDWKNWYKDKV